MKKALIFIYLFSLSSCTSSQRLLQDSFDFEVSNYISGHISEIPIVINNEKNLTINLMNAASAEKIILHIHANDNKTIQNITIRCMSQCGIELVGQLDKLKIKNLNLNNVHLLTNPKITVETASIHSSEAITTGLPIDLKTAEINIDSSPNMISVQKLLKAVNIIPGSGEFVYDTEVVYNDKGIAINAHNDEKISDASYNLKSLVRIFPNLEWSAPVISWFGVNDSNNSNMDVSQVKIVPGVEYRDIHTSKTWKVGKYSRADAHLILKDNNNRPNYGGTVNDDSVLRYIEALRSQNLKVMFYPLIAMDMPGKPWRGHIKANNPQDITNFFIKSGGYNEFILHYAHLLKNKVDAFVIGSEMQDLTQSFDPNYNYPDPRRYPAVIELINLAKQVREILGSKVIITYAANWSEYHHDKNSFHHLDPLWMSEYIDVIGIDAYLPITNKSMGDISIEEIKDGWKSGELWDYYYDRNKKSDIMPEWGLKQIEYWWKNEHWSHGIKSIWKPKIKPIWFTEFGFPSMHMATNTPNVFWNPKDVNGGVPRKSSGRPDFAIQMRAIKGTLEYWQKKNYIVQNMFLWAWDARPFPYDPKKTDIWTDGELWSRGHWINGKIEPLSQVRLLSGLNAHAIKTNANELVIEGSSKVNTISANSIQYVTDKDKTKGDMQR